MKELKRVSRWIRIDTIEVTKKHSLFCYADESEEYNGKYPVTIFRYKNRLYALNQFLSRYGMCGFDRDCKEYPSYIHGYDGTNYYKPLLIEIDTNGERIRLHEEV